MKLFFIEIKNEYLELSDYIVINCLSDRINSIYNLKPYNFEKEKKRIDYKWIYDEFNQFI